MTTYYDTGTQWINLAEADLTPVDPPTPSDMYVGAWNLPGDETSWLALEAQVGRMGMRRSYSTNFPATAPGSLTQDYGKRASWHSIKGTWATAAAGGYDGTLTTFLNSVPSGHELLLSFAHEPENDGGVASEWRAAQEHLYDVVKAVRPQTLFGPILMGYTFNPSSGRNVADWTISGSKCDFYGIDEYNPYRFPMVGNGTNWVAQPSNTMTAFTNLCSTLGVPGAVGETASAEHDSGGPSWKIGWLNDILAHCKANDFLAFCWFNAYKPGDTSEAMMLDSTPQFLAAWSDVVADHQRGVL